MDSIAGTNSPDSAAALDPRDLGVGDGEAKYEPVMSGEFLMSRFKATRKLWGAEGKATVSDDANLVEAAAE